MTVVDSWTAEIGVSKNKNKSISNRIIMRFKITFNRTGRQRMLPMDYQYYLSAWIYKILGKADRDFASFLHTEGYPLGHRRFKLFNYSPFDFGKPRLWKEKNLFEIQNDQISLIVSFQISDAAEKFIIGLFNNQQAYIGDQFNGLELAVSQVERLPEPVIQTEMHYRAISPVVISFKKEQDKYAQYLSPENDGYEKLFVNHLQTKYQSLPAGKDLPQNLELQFQLKSKPKSKLITIKPYTSQQSKVRGFVFDFSLKAPDEIHQLILSSGAGEKNSMGFGWVERIDGD